MKTKLLASSILASILILSASPAFAQGCNTGTIVGQTQGSRVNFRPSPGAPTTSYILVGQDVTILDYQGEWVKVRYEPTKAVGWVHADYVQNLCD